MDRKFQDDLKRISSRLKVEKPLATEEWKFDYRKFQPMHNQAIYVLSLRGKELVYQKNIESLLGFDEDEFNYTSPFSLIHPEDYPVVKHIVKATLVFSALHGMTEDAVLNLTYRLRKKDGTYIRVQRSSGVCRLTRSRLLEGNYSILQDISYLNLDNRVRWQWDSPTIDISKYRRFIQLAPEDFFTNREQEVYRLMRQGITEKEMAEILGISIHTLRSHRKKMLHKVNCKSTAELVDHFENLTPALEDEEMLSLINLAS
jgi:DNA-binding CsgD family transcriptional regulator